MNIDENWSVIITMGSKGSRQWKKRKLIWKKPAVFANFGCNFVHFCLAGFENAGVIVVVVYVVTVKQECPASTTAFFFADDISFPPYYRHMIIQIQRCVKKAMLLFLQIRLGNKRAFRLKIHPSLLNVTLRLRKIYVLYSIAIKVQDRSGASKGGHV